MPNVVATHSLSKRFGKVTALDQLDLQIPAGAIYGVIGPNGAGKSTLMRLLIDVLRPTAGRAEVLGQDPRTGGRELRSRIGYLPGEFVVNPRLTGNAHLKFWASLSPGRNALVRGRELSERLELDLTRHAGKLSKGNKQKLGVVQAFMHSPELLILDEPTSGLDPLNQQIFQQFVHEAHQGGATIFLSSHILSEIEQVADSAAILRAGKLVKEAGMAQLRATAARQLKAVIRADRAAVSEAAAWHGLRLEITAIGDSELRLEGHLEGHANDVVKFLSNYEVLDLVFSEPDLEDTVLGIYSDGDGEER